MTPRRVRLPGGVALVTCAVSQIANELFPVLSRPAVATAAAEAAAAIVPRL
jgi:hypothetical protein